MEKRGPRKIEVDYGRPDMFKAFAAVYGKDISSSVYSKVLNEFNKGVSKAMLEEAFEFLMPSRLGTLRIKKYKQEIKLREDGTLDTSNLAPNWQATNKLWENFPEAKANKKLVFHTNEHTDGYRCKWFFTNYRSNCKNKSAYYFVPSRTNKRTLTAHLKDEDFEGDYYM